MPGGGPVPKPPEQRHGAHKPRAGEWQTVSQTGWQHGKPPKAPSGLGATARAAWRVWMSSWVSSFWKPEDLAGLEVAIRLYDDQLAAPSAAKAAALNRLLTEYGLTPAGKQARRWRQAPEEEATSDPALIRSNYRHLRVTG